MINSISFPLVITSDVRIQEIPLPNEGVIIASEKLVTLFSFAVTSNRPHTPSSQVNVSSPWVLACLNHNHNSQVNQFETGE